ncbi:MAG: Glycosyl transferase family 2 [Bacteroidetes bacterium ADurb.BinA104]|nr:MAG: Glycosyl transferase family 2 [Bacteroidetes bacterium ADurb.BinA104]
MITCITCTGDRPQCFKLLEGWVMNQIVKPDQWIVVDDGRVPLRPAVECEYVRREPLRTDPKFTMILNIEEAFKYIKGDKILFMEDDEYYAPGYIEEISKKLDEYDLVGVGRSKYYHLPTLKWYRHKNMGHASLAQTGFNRYFLKEAQGCLKGDWFLDIRFWRMVNGREADRFTLPDDKIQWKSKDGRGLVFDDLKDSLYVGMKGMPGRKGIGIGHNERSCYYPDKNKEVLRSWIVANEDFEKYLQIKGELS